MQASTDSRVHTIRGKPLQMTVHTHEHTIHSFFVCVVFETLSPTPLAAQTNPLLNMPATVNLLLSLCPAGHDAAVAPTDWSEQHISLDVALGTLATARALNDADFNRETAFPVVSNVATWLVSRGAWTPRGFEVLHMGGPDESLGQVNNSE
jgi:hypothetical protein